MPFSTEHEDAWKGPYLIVVRLEPCSSKRFTLPELIPAKEIRASVFIRSGISYS